MAHTTREVWGHATQIFFFNRCSEIDSGAFRSSKREVYYLGCEGKVGVRRVRNYLLLCVHYTPLLMFFNIELLRNRNIFRGREESWCVFFWGGGAQINWPLVLWKIPEFPPLNETQVWVDSPVCLFWLAEVASAWMYLSTKDALSRNCQSSAYHYKS